MSKANIYDSFTILKEMILGDVDIAWASLSPLEHKSRIEHILSKTKEDLSNTASLLESLGIVVHRPKIYPLKPITTPYFQTSSNRIPLSPADLFLILGNTIVETASYDRQRLFENTTCRHIMFDYFNKGNQLLSMPLPLLTDDSYTSEGLSENEILMEASNILQVGKDIFVTVQSSGNEKGLNWFKKQFSEFNFHQVDNVNGHIDCHWAILRPGLLVCDDPKTLHPKFKNWEVITTDGTLVTEQLLDSNLQDDDWENTTLGITFLVLSSDKILFNAALKDSYIGLIKNLEAKQFDVCFSEITYGGFFNQGLTCMCLETRREGLLENYF